MNERISISELKEISKKHGLDHIICFATKRKVQFVATYGNTIEACDQAAQFGDILKDKLGWPESFHAIPSRVKRLQAENERLRGLVKELIGWGNLLAEEYDPNNKHNRVR
jgi:hypothetical protein